MKAIWLPFITLLMIACGGRANDVPPNLAVERFTSGDTTVVRNSGTDSPLAELTLERELVIGRSVGSDQEMFGQIRIVYAADDGGVIVTEYKPYRIQRFDSTGKLTRVYGGRGEGPGEFEITSRIGLDAKGNFYHWDQRHRYIVVYDSAGKFVRNWKPPTGPDTVAHILSFAIDSDQVLNAQTLLIDGKGHDRSTIMRATLDGNVLGAMPAPAAYGPPEVTVKFRAEFGMDSYTLPLTPLFLSSFVEPHAWATAHSENYSILLHKPGQLIRIDSDHAAVVVSAKERGDAALATELEVRKTDASVRVDSKLIPAHKPLIKQIRGDGSERIWVQLYAPAHRTTVVRCPSTLISFTEAPTIATSCADGQKPRPIPTWIEPVVLDVFQPTGEFAGRVTLPTGSDFRTARNNKVWLASTDSLGAQIIVRYRVVPKPESPLSALWK
jgi:hypothetical protein